MFDVRADVQKNRLYITFHGFFEFKEMKECTDKTIEEARKLKPGFDVITDISDFKAVGQDTISEVTRAQAFFRKSGVRHAIRVTGNAAIANVQFSRVGKTVDYIPQAVNSLADAEKILDAELVKS